MNRTSTTDSDTENDQEQHENADRPLLPSSHSQPLPLESVKYNLTTEIQLPKPKKRKPSKKSSNKIYGSRNHRFLSLITKLRDYRRSLIPGRIRLGTIVFSFFVIIYLRFLITGENRTTEWTVNVPPVDESLHMPKGVFIFHFQLFCFGNLP